ncbi:hypothetical protein, partial [Halorussus sp. GCM10023401]
MHRVLRYAVALLVGAAATGGVAAVTPAAERTPILLVGIAQVSVAGATIALRYPSALWRTDGANWTSAAFVGVATFGAVALLNGVETGPNFAAAALGVGLAWFGFVAGLA